MKSPIFTVGYFIGYIEIAMLNRLEVRRSEAEKALAATLPGVPSVQKRYFYATSIC
jgi:hypothetical protein